MGKGQEAIHEYERTLELRPDDWTTHVQLGVVLLSLNRTEEAEKHLNAAAALAHDNPKGLNYIGRVLVQLGYPAAAIPPLSEASRLNPDWIDPIKELAFLYLTAPDTTVNNPGKALELAKRAAQMSKNQDPSVLQILAGAYASNGRLDDAMRTAAEAVPLAEAARAPKLADQLRAQMAVYRSAKATETPGR
jgi:Flp pilus assembly protein TadD